MHFNLISVTCRLLCLDYNVLTRRIRYSVVSFRAMRVIVPTTNYRQNKDPYCRGGIRDDYVPKMSHAKRCYISHIWCNFWSCARETSRACKQGFYTGGSRYHKVQFTNYGNSYANATKQNYFLNFLINIAESTTDQSGSGHHFVRNTRALHQIGWSICSESVGWAYFFCKETNVQRVSQSKSHVCLALMTFDNW